MALLPFPRCRQAENIVKKSVAESGVAAWAEKITDTMEIAGYGILGTPAAVFDGEVKSVGKIPNKERVVGWIQERSVSGGTS